MIGRSEEERKRGMWVRGLGRWGGQYYDASFAMHTSVIFCKIVDGLVHVERKCYSPEYQQTSRSKSHKTASRHLHLAPYRLKRVSHPSAPPCDVQSTTPCTFTLNVIQPTRETIFIIRSLVLLNVSWVYNLWSVVTVSFMFPSSTFCSITMKKI